MAGKGRSPEAGTQLHIPFLSPRSLIEETRPTQPLVESTILDPEAKLARVHAGRQGKVYGVDEFFSHDRDTRREAEAAWKALKEQWGVLTEAEKSEWLQIIAERVPAYLKDIGLDFVLQKPLTNEDIEYILQVTDVPHKSRLDWDSSDGFTIHPSKLAWARDRHFGDLVRKDRSTWKREK